MSTNGKKKSETRFNIGSETIEDVKSYPYAGIELTNTGSMKMAQTNLSCYLTSQCEPYLN